MRYLLAPLLLWAASLAAQPANPSIVSVTTAPSGACTAGLPNQQVVSTGTQYSCQSGTWGAIGASVGGATLPFPGIVYGTSATGGTVATGAQVASAISGQAITPSAVGSPSMTPQAIDCHTACSPTAAQLSNAMVANFGQGASNVAITGPTAAAGMNFIMIAGTAQASNYWQYTSTTANIYLDGSATAKTTITFAAPGVGNSFSCFSFQTGAGPTYSLKCTTLAGTSTSS